MIRKLQLGMLSEKWLNTDKIVIYGLGVMARKCIDMLMEDFHIPYIIDNAPEKSGTFYKGIPVISQEEAKRRNEWYPMVVIATINVYNSISETLAKDGFVENEDYCLLDLFVAEWYWHNRKQVHLVEVHTTITTRCTLKCRNCNMFMPYFNNHAEISLEAFRQDIDALFHVADKVFSIGLLGGEPFLNDQLADMIGYLSERYGDRIGEITVITNGTILPDEKLLQALKSCNVRVHVSDYTSAVPYEKRLEEFEQAMIDAGIEYRINTSLVWSDFGFPEQPFNFADVRTHMMECFPVFRGLNDKKLYFCHVAWSAEKLGKYRLKEGDYFDLLSETIDSEEEKKRFLNYSLGGKEDWHLSFCKVCGGCGPDNTKYVDAGAQVKGKLG